jgi:glycosyltransferase involved in cell wall biosynthesis
MDIIICTYNNAVLLNRTLHMISDQAVGRSHSWSVLVIDNNCTDKTAAIVEQHIQSQKIPGLRRIVETKQGLTYARLCGVHNTPSDWIAFVDDDCLLSENWVENAIQFAASHANCGAFGGKVILDWETPPSPKLVKHSAIFAACDRGNEAKRLDQRTFHIPGAGLVVYRPALEQSGWLDQQFLVGREGNILTAGDDSEIVLRIRNAGYELWYSPDCVLYHFIPDHRISEAYLAKVIYGMGIAAPYIAGLRWRQSYLLWLIISILRIVKYSLETILSALRSIIDPNQRSETLIKWQWTKGQIDGLMTILTRCDQDRKAWIGMFEL